MHGHKRIKSTLKITFLTFQALLFITGIFLAIFTFSIYFKPTVMKVPFKALIYGLIFSVTFTITSIIAFYAFTHSKANLIFIYVCVSLFLMNFQMLLSLHIPALVDKTEKYGDKRWDELDPLQRTFVQDSMMCCGWYSENDRSESDCKFTTGCSKIIKKMAVTIRDRLTIAWVLLFFVESMSICILLLLRMKVKVKKNEKTT